MSIKTKSSSFINPITIAAAATTLATISYYIYDKKAKQKKKLERERVLAKKSARIESFNHKVKKRQSDIQSLNNIETEEIEAEAGRTYLADIKINDVFLWEIEYLGNYFDSEAPKHLINHMQGLDYGSIRQRKQMDDSNNYYSYIDDDDDYDNDLDISRKTHYNKLIGLNECVLADIVRKPGKSTSSVAYVRAGPRRELHFDPSTVNAAIVTCGGLCPGLNNVVREITNSLFFLYGIKGKVYGICGGYKGFYDPEYEPILLTPQVVEDIHHKGGTILGSSRGGFDLEKILDFIKRKQIKQLYVIGGDGTHRGAFRIHEGCMEKGMNVAVAGIPKTIDNDVDYIDRSFGFLSSVEAALDAIRCAKTEASCNLPNGIGIVKLMGRSAGFIAAHATLGSADVDLCLLPEVPIVLEGDLGCLPFLYRRVKQKGYAVVVVAEGAGEELLGTSTEVDASGNKKLPKIGEFMKTAAENYFSKLGETATVKYIDPSYMIRSVPANSFDSLYCQQLAQNAVHGTMAGFTGFSVGLCNNKMVLLPIPQLVRTSPRMMDCHGRTWERVLAQTRQPNTVPHAM
jgi:6-phosphofructokinase 1